MITTLISDFSKVLLFVKDESYKGKLNALNRQLITENKLYPFFDYFVLNQELLNFYETLKNEHSISLNIFTTGTVQERPELQPFLLPLFDNIFSANKLNLNKEDPRSYLVIADRMRMKPGEVVYVDDKQTNIDAALRSGMQAVLYTDIVSVKIKVQKLL